MVKYALSTQYAFLFLAILGVPIFDPKWTRFVPNHPKQFHHIICY